MSAHEAINWDQHYGKAFRIAKAPREAVNGPGDDAWSIVTPENGDSWNEWPDADQKHIDFAKKNWDTIQSGIADYKMGQIRRSMK